MNKRDRRLDKQNARLWRQHDKAPYGSTRRAQVLRKLQNIQEKERQGRRFCKLTVAVPT